MKLEPKPERAELTFSQQQLINQARSFITKKMARRSNLRDQKSKAKDIAKMKKELGLPAPKASDDAKPKTA